MPGGHLKSWLDVVDALYEGSWRHDLQRFRSPYAFRGNSRVAHTLASSLVRLSRPGVDVHRLELALLRNFRKYAHEQGAAADSVWDWLALGQHRGLPTRLLDWTYSPLVALHFVTQDPVEFDEDGVVWCVNFVEANKRLPRKLRRILEQEGSDTLTVEMLGGFETLRDFDALGRDPFVVFVEPPTVDTRILNQLSLFSLMSTPTATLDDWLHEHPELWRRVVVPARLKWEIRDKLDQANINERVLFPGLDGISRWLARYYTPIGGQRNCRNAETLPSSAPLRGMAFESRAAPPRQSDGPAPENGDTHLYAKSLILNVKNLESLFSTTYAKGECPHLW